jgi:hypothetical protein
MAARFGRNWSCVWPALLAVGAGAALGACHRTSFSEEIEPQLTFVCARVGCHTAVDATAGLVLESGVAYANLVGVTPMGPACGGGVAVEAARVTPGDPAGSLMYTKISGTQTCGERMPYMCDATMTCLDAEFIATVEDWILDGAPDN